VPHRNWSFWITNIYYSLPKSWFLKFVGLSGKGHRSWLIFFVLIACLLKHLLIPFGENLDLFRIFLDPQLLPFMRNQLVDTICCEQETNIKLNPNTAGLRLRFELNHGKSPKQQWNYSKTTLHNVTKKNTKMLEKPQQDSASEQSCYWKNLTLFYPS